MSEESENIGWIIFKPFLSVLKGGGVKGGGKFSGHGQKYMKVIKYCI